MLRPCPYRTAQLDGQLTCAKIGGPDREVTPEICAACPAAQIGCAHLRFSLVKNAPSPLLIRWGNGKQEVLAADAPRVELARGACGEQVMPVHGPSACAACPLHQSWELTPTTATRRQAKVSRALATRTVILEEALPPAANGSALAPASSNTTLVQPSNILVFRRKSA
ncbi:MAG: hypothetical protein KIT87_11840 [Anaerolineae bacterium]|nr:hypothetical protein [Anaerolineae bacterium]